MEYRLGNSKWVKSAGDTVEITCPECNEKGHFGVFTNADTRLKTTFPLFTNNDVYFLVCPKCATVFTVEESIGKTFKDGELLSIGDYSLKKLKKFK